MTQKLRHLPFSPISSTPKTLTLVRESRVPLFLSRYEIFVCSKKRRLENLKNANTFRFTLLFAAESLAFQSRVSKEPGKTSGNVCLSLAAERRRKTERTKAREEGIKAGIG